MPAQPTLSFRPSSLAFGASSSRSSASSSSKANKTSRTVSSVAKPAAAAKKKKSAGTPSPRKRRKTEHNARDDDGVIVLDSSSSSSSAEDEQWSEKKPETRKVKREDDSDALWADRFAPQTADELAIHPRKVEDVRTWLKEAFEPKLSKYRKLLVLHGPAGAGKTATLKVLASEFDAEIVEYVNSSTATFMGDTERHSAMEAFTSFVSRAAVAPTLTLAPEGSTSKISASSKSQSFDDDGDSRRKLLVVEDLPNVSHWPTRQRFQASLRQFLNSPRARCPLVVVVSDALVRPGGSADEGGFSSGDSSLDARSTCGVEVLGSPACRAIRFNPVARTILKKALVRSLDKANVKDRRPSPQAIDFVAAHSNGDIRSAVASLQFLCHDAKAAANAEEQAVVAPKGGKGKAKGKGKAIGTISETEMKRLLNCVSSRESSLVLFHALGKILYNKRWGESADDDKKDKDRAGIAQDEGALEKLPRHLRTDHARRRSKVDPNTLYGDIATSVDVFDAYLAHNVPAFCETVHELSGVLSYLSDAEALLSRGGAGTQYAFQTASRGLLMALPCPVPRRKQVVRKSEIFDSMRSARSNEAALDELGASVRGLAIARAEEDGGVATQRSRRSLITEVIPFAGFVAKRRPATLSTAAGFTTFVRELATFPPPEANAGLTGAALEEDDAAESEEEAQEELMELVEEDNARTVDVEPLYDPEDDIEDPD